MKLLLSVFIMASFAMLIGCGISFRADCTARNTTTPEAPIFPASTIVEEYPTDYSSWSSRDIEYTVKDTFAHVNSYYMAKASCVSLDWGTSCSGNSSPFGKYSVQIHEESSATTSYAVHIIWDKCPDDGDWHVSVE